MRRWVEFTDDDPDASLSAVWPFFGQFIAHDIAADRSPLGSAPSDSSTSSLRSPMSKVELNVNTTAQLESWREAAR